MPIVSISNNWLTRREAIGTSIGIGFAAALGHRTQLVAAPLGRSVPTNSGEIAKWRTLPATPPLPPNGRPGLAPINETSIFFAQFGAGPPLLFLHGGLGNSNYWGRQIEEFSAKYSVLVMDTRGHGRSPVTSSVFSYRVFGTDVIALLDHLQIPQAMIVGWSDGAITGLQLAITAKDRITKLFAFGANTSNSGLKKGGAGSKVFSEYAARCKTEYANLSPRPDRWPQLNEGLRAMWRSEPNFTAQELGSIVTPTAISDGMYDEIIMPLHVKQIAKTIPRAKLIIQPEVGHFAMLQDPLQFNQVLLEFLET
jgi:pimeloyl-ACP methyl ester carboxylesterase